MQPIFCCLQSRLVLPTHFLLRPAGDLCDPFYPGALTIHPLTPQAAVQSRFLFTAIRTLPYSQCDINGHLVPSWGTGNDGFEGGWLAGDYAFECVVSMLFCLLYSAEYIVVDFLIVFVACIG